MCPIYSKDMVVIYTYNCYIYECNYFSCLFINLFLYKEHKGKYYSYTFTDMQVLIFEGNLQYDPIDTLVTGT